MKNLRYANASHTTILAEDDQEITRDIPVAPDNAHYRAIRQRVEAGEAAAFVPDPAAAEAARKAKVAARMLDALADDANAGKTLDQIRADAKAAVDARGAQ